jgi:hypothetical protein
MILCVLTLSIPFKLSTKILNKMVFNTDMLSVVCACKLSHYAECHNDKCRYTECHYAENHNDKCCYASCHYANVVMINAVMPSVIFLDVMAPQMIVVVVVY